MLIINAHTISCAIIIYCQLYGASVISYAAIIINMISPLCGADNFMK